MLHYLNMCISLIVSAWHKIYIPLSQCVFLCVLAEDIHQAEHVYPALPCLYFCVHIMLPTVCELVCSLCKYLSLIPPDFENSRCSHCSCKILGPFTSSFYVWILFFISNGWTGCEISALPYLTLDWFTESNTTELRLCEIYCDIACFVFYLPKLSRYCNIAKR